MTHEQLEAVRKATEVLPEKFSSGQFYNPDDKTYCFWGWVLKQVGRDPAQLTAQHPTQESYWTWLRENMIPGFSLVHSDVADDAISQRMTPAEVREVVLADLETRVREVSLG